MPSVCSSSSAAMLIRRNSQGKNNNPPITASATKAPIRPSVSPIPVAAAPLRWASEPNSVIITTATTSSITVMVIAIWPERSWAVPVSCSTLLMIAEDEVINIAARNRLSVGFQPATTPNNRVR